MKDQINNHVSALADDIITWRRHLHQHPELSFEEYETTLYITDKLKQLAIPFRSVSETGVIGFINGNGKSDKTLALRADIDALPITEENDVVYKSLHTGVMHACGHDFHTATLLGVATILKKMEQQLDGNIILIFQAAEEKIPGGAQAVVASGVLDVPNLIGVIGQHVSPKIEVGKFGYRAGKFMASSDELYIDIKGKGGHGAQPHLNIDPVSISAQLIVTLQQIVSRYANPAIPTVLSFGKVIANGAANVIPDTVHLEGTFRTMDESWREKALSLMENIIKELPQTLGAEVKVEVRRGYPALLNNELLIQKIKKAALAVFAEEQITDTDLWMAAEDFAYYAKQYPAAFYLIGTKCPEKNLTAELHNPHFNIDEDILPESVRMMTNLAVALINE
ncbi:M20 family metallopeptidase [Sphingobacterium spiritivorum]|uniref:M20 metallopeptidase family protein n=1 Tax=Sphingobacterium spiritivorum TaxID=258 RepID=UPI001917ABBD|nr:M20 family metallopeptidase [Sphingobacterium spiritivorum]QQT24715.1 amidohydrolase [Sphingobacterium spiritivorum]